MDNIGPDPAATHRDEHKRLGNFCPPEAYNLGDNRLSSNKQHQQSNLQVVSTMKGTAKWPPGVRARKVLLIRQACLHEKMANAEIEGPLFSYKERAVLTRGRQQACRFTDRGDAWILFL